MVAAAFGLLTPVEGALLQEAIDVVVILNALRALTGGGARAVQLAGWNELRATLEIEHRQLLPLVASVGRMADTCDDLAPGDARRRLASLADELDDRLLRHEQLEETTVYPALAAAIGGQDPMAVMSGSHREIFHLVRLLRRNITRLDETGRTPSRCATSAGSCTACTPSWPSTSPRRRSSTRPSRTPARTEPAFA